MPDFMEAKYARHKVEYLCDVNNCAEGVNHAADDEPCQHPGGEHGQQLSACADNQPAHGEIETRIQPARYADNKNLYADADQRQRLDGDQHAPLPETCEGIDAERCICTCDQEVDGGMVNFAKYFQCFIFGAHHVIGGTG